MGIKQLICGDDKPRDPAPSDAPGAVTAEPTPEPHTAGEVAERFACCGAPASYWTSRYAYDGPRTWVMVRVLRHADTCPTLTDYPLAAFHASGACPKCRGASDAVYHKDTALADVGWDDPRLGRQRGCLLGYNSKPVEHLERTCRACGYRWAERVAA